MSTRFPARIISEFWKRLGEFYCPKKTHVFFLKKKAPVVVVVGLGGMNFSANLSWRLQVFFSWNFLYEANYGEGAIFCSTWIGPQEKKAGGRPQILQVRKWPKTLEIPGFRFKKHSPHIRVRGSKFPWTCRFFSICFFIGISIRRIPLKREIIKNLLRFFVQLRADQNQICNEYTFRSKMTTLLFQEAFLQNKKGSRGSQRPQPPTAEHQVMFNYEVGFPIFLVIFSTFPKSSKTRERWGFATVLMGSYTSGELSWVSRPNAGWILGRDERNRFLKLLMVMENPGKTPVDLVKISLFHIWFIVFLVVVSFFFSHSYLGRFTILTNIFQMGWNHQLGFL